MAKRKPEQEAHEEHADETWLIPYSDLLTLLLALFIVLFASSKLDKAKMSQMEAAFAAAFNAATGLDKLSGNLGEFMSSIQELGLDSSVSLGSDDRGVAIDIGSLSMFAPGKSDLLDSIHPVLNQIITLLQQPRYKRFRITVEGHTDDIEASDSDFPSKWELSSNRAAAVVRYFIKKGIASERLQVIGRADIAPKLPNYNAYNEPVPENRSRNRRIEIHIEP